MPRAVPSFTSGLRLLMADKKKKRKRTVPRNIRDKPDREIMEAVFGKRITKAATAEAQTVKRVTSPMKER